MSTSAAPFDEARAHRWFAAEANNLAWDLLALTDRSDADTQRMLHAAAFHWLPVGRATNQHATGRRVARHGLSRGRSAEALRYAKAGSPYFPPA